MQEVTYTVHIEPAEESGFIAYFPALPGCHTQGETLEEVVAMAKEALAGYLESLEAHGEKIPQESRERSRFAGIDLPLKASVAR
jgi:antitoxin HicB